MYRRDVCILKSTHNQQYQTIDNLREVSEYFWLFIDSIILLARLFPSDMSTIDNSNKYDDLAFRKDHKFLASNNVTDLYAGVHGGRFRQRLVSWGNEEHALPIRSNPVSSPRWSVSFLIACTAREDQVCTWYAMTCRQWRVQPECHFWLWPTATKKKQFVKLIFSLENPCCF